MTTKEYTQRLKSLSDTNKDLLQRITKLSKFTLPTTGHQQQQEGSSEPESRVELSEEIHASLKELENEFELFKQEAEDVTGPSIGNARRHHPDKDKERLALVTQIERFSEDLKLSRAQFRRAQLQAKRNEEAAARKAREELFAGLQDLEESGGSRPPSRLRRGGNNDNRTQEDVVLSAAGDVTAGLRRTHQLMSQELERSRFAHETLQNSTAALNSLGESYSGLDDLLKASRGLISALVSSQKSDTWYLETALKILVVTLVWLIFRRWFYGPILYLLYKPSRFVLGTIYSALNLVLGIITGAAFQGAPNTPSIQGGLAPASGTRPPLKIQRSAQGGVPRRSSGQPIPSVKAGVGGGGEAEGRSEKERRKDDETLPGRIGRMAEDTKNKEKKMTGEQPPQDGVAGGTVLRERKEDEKPNPKKRMMEEPPEPSPAKEEGMAKDEL